MENWRKNPILFAILSIPGSFWLVAFFLIPLSYIWVLGFADKLGISDYVYHWSLANYRRAFQWVYLGILFKSLWISAIATFLCLIIAYPIVFAICFAPAKWRSILLFAAIMPFWINLMVRTYALLAMFRTNGIVNWVIGWIWNGVDGLFGGKHPYHPFELLYNNGAVIVGLVYVYLPFMILPLYATLEKLDKTYLEASLDLGASQWRTLISITLPLTMPGIISGIILVFIPCLGTFLISGLLGGANAIMIGNLIEDQFKAANDYPFGSALSFLLIYVTFGILALRWLFTAKSDRWAT